MVYGIYLWSNNFMYANEQNMLLPKQDNVKYIVKHQLRLLAILSATTSAYNYLVKMVQE